MTLYRYVEWVSGAVLPLWQERGFDEDTGLFRERLRFDGTPVAGADLRLRTHVRQVYVLAHGALLGLLPPEAALGRATTAMETIRARAWAPDGRPGWVHRLAADGRVVDPRRDLYDHAFVLHALAWMIAATGDPRYAAWADETLAAIDTLMAAPAGGWAESDGQELPRRQNPHMHLLEACLALHDATKDPRHLARAGGIVALFRNRLFDERLGTLREFFGPRWEIAEAYGSGRLEPGHMMEWVVLLRRYERASADPVEHHTTALLAAAERIGVDGGGFLLDEVDARGTPLRNTRRLWPQTEYLTACLASFGVTGDERYLARADAMAGRLAATYLRGALPGLWIDCFDLAGNVAVDHVPASILYHLMAPVAEHTRLKPHLPEAFGGSARTVPRLPPPHADVPRSLP